VLKREMDKFMFIVRDNMIDSWFCPVCRSDLRSTYRDQPNQERKPGQGTCTVCNLGIQLHHRVAHDGHVVNEETQQLCEYRITVPVSLVNEAAMKKLRAKWVEMGLPRRPLTEIEQVGWLTEVSSILKEFKLQ
jgi:hypothetical protein